jgi:hypothetical protein
LSDGESGQREQHGHEEEERWGGWPHARRARVGVGRAGFKLWRAGTKYCSRAARP